MAPMPSTREAAGAAILAKLAHGLYRSRERMSTGGGLAGRFRDAAEALRGRAEAAAAGAPPGPAAGLARAVAGSGRPERDLTAAEVEALRSDLSRELERLAERDRREPPACAA